MNFSQSLPPRTVFDEPCPMTKRKLVAIFRVVEEDLGRLWNKTHAEAKAKGHPNPNIAAHEATTAIRQETLELEAEIHARTAALPLDTPTDRRIAVLLHELLLPEVG